MPCCNTEAEVVVRVSGRVVVAISHTCVRRIVVPAAATFHPVGTIERLPITFRRSVSVLNCAICATMLPTLRTSLSSSIWPFEYSRSLNLIFLIHLVRFFL